MAIIYCTRKPWKLENNIMKAVRLIRTALKTQGQQCLGQLSCTATLAHLCCPLPLYMAHEHPPQGLSQALHNG